MGHNAELMLWYEIVLLIFCDEMVLTFKIGKTQL